MSDEIKASVCDLLRKHSALNRDTTFFRSSGDHDWKPLDAEGCQLQSKVHNHYNKLLALLRALLRSQTQSIQDSLEEESATVSNVIDQEDSTWTKTTEEAIGNCHEALDRQVGLVATVYDGTVGRHVYVPDTNALLYQPQLEDWEFDGSPDFVVVLMPTVLSELDQLKVNHRNEDVRRKAEGLIRRIKGYRARGRLADGVPLRKGRSTLQTIAIEPKMEETLPWLKADNNDDRILAAFIEVMREHPRCQVILVTRDMNLQNKAEYAGLPFIEPPEPTAAPGTK